MNISKKLSWLFMSGFFSLFFVMLPNKASAINYSDFKPGRIIDDAIFTNKSSMNVDQIQAFLNSKVPVCETRKQATFTGGSGTIYYAPFTCLKDYQENITTGVNNYGKYATDNVTPLPVPGGIGAAQIIWQVAQNYNINPQVLLVTLQKEQALITDTWPILPQFTKATGYDCPDRVLPVDVDANRNGCYDTNEGFYKQVNGTGWQLRNDFNGIGTPGFDSAFRKGVNNIYYNPDPSCGSKTVNIETQATAILYKYTPYTPNDAAITAAPGVEVPCGAYGNRNFWRLFTSWFGSPYAFVLNGITYDPVFNPEYYLSNNPDLQAVFGGDQLRAFSHFVRYGMGEGRQGSANFNVTSYKNRYPDLRRVFGNNLARYYFHFVNFGSLEGRIAIGDIFVGETVLNGVNYGDVYDFSYYQTNNPDVKINFGNNDGATLSHFVRYGMGEGRQAKDNFNVNSYRGRYVDLRRAFGDNLTLYYWHFITNGVKEGRIATGSDLGGATIINNTDYGAVYSFEYYVKNNSDLSAAFGLNDEAALRHFINYGMGEGRQAIGSFNVLSYRDKYADLRLAFGSNLPRYFWHYINYGMKEGRSSS